MCVISSRITCCQILPPFAKAGESSNIPCFDLFYIFFSCPRLGQDYFWLLQATKPSVKAWANHSGPLGDLILPMRVLD